MVDGIDKIGAPRIDWYKLTIKEIKQYEAEGSDEEMPTEVKRWAEEMAKMANIPDTVTYEMSKAGAASTQNPENENTEITTGDSQLDLALSLGAQSDLAADEVESLMSEIEDWTANAAAANDEAQNQYDSVMSRINALEAERASAAARGDKAKTASLTEKLAEVGGAAQGVLGKYSNMIAEMTNNISGLTSSAQKAMELGNQAVEFGSLSPLAASAVEQGENAISVGTNAFTQSSASEIEIGAFGQNVRAHITDVQETSGTPSVAEASEEEKTKTEDEIKDETSKEVEETKKDENKESEKDEEWSLSNEDITADPIEMLKRKERKGEM